MNQTIKIHAYLARKGVASRRKVEELVAEGLVTVNGRRAIIGQRVDPATDEIAVNGKIMQGYEKKRYFLVYKPVGYISTTRDELLRKNVLFLVPEINERLYPVGRLDKDSEGLMLLTNDGDLAYRLTHPKFQLRKTYEVTISGKPSSAALNHLKRGVKLREGFVKPDEVVVIENLEGTTVLHITIHQGLNRQIRRMFERIGYDIIKLVRIRLDIWTLDDLEGRGFKEISV
ncbi:rRNA pseudouridine synthase [Candidatus Woesebacteria bacterium]|nr:rRNA pseudouridine synthase [Candidatus Woesebacteria bacterium]